MSSSSGKPALLHASHSGRTFTIEEDPTAGFYVYAFEGERCTHDHLQATLALAKECAREEFGVPEDAWHEATITGQGMEFDDSALFVLNIAMTNCFHFSRIPANPSNRECVSSL